MGQSRLKKFMTNCVDIYRKSGESDNFGGVKASWAKKCPKVSCRIYGASGSQVVAFGITGSGTDVRVDRKMICELDVDIKEGDKVVDATYDEEFFVVKVKPIHATKKAHHIECLLTRTKV